MKFLKFQTRGRKNFYPKRNLLSVKHQNIVLAFAAFLGLSFFFFENIVKLFAKYFLLDIHNKQVSGYHSE